MGKKKQTPLEMLACKLLGTNKNVFTEACQLGIAVPDGDTLFARLEKECGVFKCEMCDTWKETDVLEPRNGSESSYCSECFNEGKREAKPMAKGTMFLNLTQAETVALEALCKEQDLSKTAVLRQALRLYQLVHEKQKQGHPLRFAGEVAVGCPAPE